MEKVLFLCGLIPRDDEIVENTINFMNNAADAFQTLFIEGIRQNGYEPKVLSAPFIGPFPKSYKKIYYKSKSYSDGCRYVSFNNIWGIRNYFRYAGLKKELKKKEYQNINKAMVYSVHTPFAKVARYLKKTNPNIQICLITPDLPEYMNLRKNKTLLYRVAKKFDCRAFYKLIKYFDCFSFVSAHQSEKINKWEKPETVIESMVREIEETYFPTNNLKKKIVYTGSLNKQFGIMNLIDAVKGIDKDVELILCGSGDALQEIQALEDNRVKYLGVLDHEAVRKVQLNADVLVNPRTNEGEYTKYSFPSKIMEYLSTGRPVVCYKIDGIPDEYNQHLIFPKDESVVELRNTIEAALFLDEHSLKDIYERNTAFLKGKKTPKVMIGKIFTMFDML